jgi:hypothetical protein
LTQRVNDAVSTLSISSGAESQRASPPRQLELPPSGAAEFVICDHTIELLFQVWKRHGRVDESRSTKPWRILCAVYAKLLAMLVQHWVFLVSCWAAPNRSLVTAAQTVQKHALHLASTCGSHQRLLAALRTVQRCVAAGCRMNRRKKSPNTYQLLLDDMSMTTALA